MTLFNETREYKLDFIQVYRKFEAGITTVNVVFEEDRDMFDCKFDLTANDLFEDDAKAMLYYTTQVEPESVILYIEMNGVEKQMKVEQD